MSHVARLTIDKMEDLALLDEACAELHREGRLPNYASQRHLDPRLRQRAMSYYYDRYGHDGYIRWRRESGSPLGDVEQEMLSRMGEPLAIVTNTRSCDAAGFAMDGTFIGGVHQGEEENVVRQELQAIRHRYQSKLAYRIALAIATQEGGVLEELSNGELQITVQGGTL